MDKQPGPGMRANNVWASSSECVVDKDRSAPKFGLLDGSCATTDESTLC